MAQSEFLAGLVKRASALREASAPRPYWPERMAATSGAQQVALSAGEAKQRFAGMIDEFDRGGYVERVFPRECVDGPHDVKADKSAKLQELLGAPDLWPLQPAGWDDDTFYGLIDVFHPALINR